MKTIILKLAAAASIALAFACSGKDDPPPPPANVAVTDVTLDKQSISFAVGAEENLTASVVPDTATNKAVSWNSSNASVAAWEGSGPTVKIKAVGVGTATITVTAADTTNGTKTKTCTVNVTATNVPVESVTLDKKTMTLAMGGEDTLTATVLPAGATNKNVTWRSSNTNVANVGGMGATVTISAGDSGTAIITATSAADPGKSDTCTVTVPAPTYSAYVGGAFGLVKDGVAQGAYSGSHIRSVYVDDAGVVYACGFSSPEAAYWRGGTKHTLPRTAGTLGAEALGMCFDGGNVYIAGYEATQVGEDLEFTARLWSGSASAATPPATVTIPKITGATYSVATGVCRLGGSTYLCGGVQTPGYYYDEDGEPYPGFIIWNLAAGTTFEATFGSNPAGEAFFEATSITAGPDGLLYATGDTSGLLVFNPTNGSNTQPMNPNTNGVALSVKFVGSTLYASGYSGASPWPPCYWTGAIGGTYAKTLLPEALSSGAAWAEAMDIAVAPDGVIYTCGREYFSQSRANGPKLWRGTTPQTVPAWQGASSGIARTVFVK
jgi:hypothetical protein